MQFEVLVTGATDRGLERENNEDNFATFSYVFPNHNVRLDILVVTDGLGGGEAADIMSYIGMKVPTTHIISSIFTAMPAEMVAATKPSEEIFHFLDGKLPEVIEEAIQKGNEKIIEYGRQRDFKSGTFGVTIVVATVISNFKNGKVSISGWNEGNTRASWWNGTELIKLSKDHILLSPYWPYRFLGSHRSIGGDPFSLQIGVGKYPEVSLLLYTNGLWTMIQPDPTKSPLELIEMAKTVQKPQLEGATPGEDNITVIKWQARVKKEN